MDIDDGNRKGKNQPSIAFSLNKPTNLNDILAPLNVHYCFIVCYTKLLIQLSHRCNCCNRNQAGVKAACWPPCSCHHWHCSWVHQRSGLVTSTTSKASYYQPLISYYWEMQLGKTALNSNGTVVAKKTVSSAFNSSRSKDFPCTIDSDPMVFTQWRTQHGLF